MVLNVHPRTRLPFLAVALAATLSLVTAPAASADPDKFQPERTTAKVQPNRSTVTFRSTVKVAASRAAVQTGMARGDARMGWKNASSTDLMTSAAAKGPTSGVQGIDVSRWQGDVNWPYWKAQGKSFAYIKATEGTTYQNRYFSSQYNGAEAAGLIRGAYHFASPSGKSGKAQAQYFVAHGGAWRDDGKTLPGVLDIEYNPYGATCYGLSKKKMVKWIKSFTKEYKARTGRDAVIYTTRDWWRTCTGNSKKFHRTNPLWVARYASKVGKLPGGWTYYTFWQYSTNPLDQDRFSASRKRLLALANG